MQYSRSLVQMLEQGACNVYVLIQRRIPVCPSARTTFLLIFWYTSLSEHRPDISEKLQPRCNYYANTIN